MIASRFGVVLSQAREAAVTGARRVVRPAVLRDIPLDRHVVIDASAGTGKTFTLENLVVELVLSTDLTIDRLLCVTFTEKATHEIRARVRGKLEALLSGRGEPATDEQVRAGDSWTIDDRSRKKLETRPPRVRRVDHRDDPRLLPPRAARERVRQRPLLRGASGRRTRGVRARVARRAPGQHRARPGARAVARGRAAERLVDRTHRGAPLELRARARAESGRRSTRRRSTRRSRRSRSTTRASPRNLGELKAWGVHGRTASDDRAGRCRISRTSSTERAPPRTPRCTSGRPRTSLGKLRERLPQLRPRPGRAARRRRGGAGAHACDAAASRRRSRTR